MLLEPSAPHSTSPMPPPDPQPPLPPERSPAAEPSSAAERSPAPEPPGERQGALFEVDVPPWEQDVEQGICAGVVFSEPPFGPFHYRVPPPLIETVQPGMRLRVPLGRGNRSVVGWCVEVTDTVRGGRSFKDVAAVLDAAPLCSPAMVQLVLWMSDYYQAAPGQVFDALIPSGVRAAAGTRERTYLTPAREALDDRVIDALPTKQRSVLRHLIAAARPLTVGQLATLAETTDETVRRLRRRGLLRAEVRREMEIDPLAGGLGPRPQQGDRLELTEPQQQALQAILEAVDRGGSQTLLLQGVTGSGKTEVYIRAIEHLGRSGRQAIVLVPEISLTPQTRQRFEDRFAGVAVLHSQMTPTERHYHWQRIAAGQIDVVVGPRSAIFAPLPRLGLIVIDEEHDGSFKQDSVPRYHARDVARRRAEIEGVPLVLGSATPSLESWHAARTGSARLLRLEHRVENRPMPEVQLVDLRLKGERTGGSISRPLHQAIREAITDSGQVILLLNRRGFATTIQCPACGHVVACPDCDQPLTHHRDGGKAICHYCDYQIPTPPWCPACRFDGIRYAGRGTQRLEVEVKARFPEVSVARMDSDTMRRPGSHERVLSAFRKGEVQILLGTQMIAKGLDFPNVLLVGVINADSALHFPDFRAAERTFQLVTQVAGRTGRGSRGGRVVVQTFSPEHPAIQAAARHDYDTFAETEMRQREKFAYPPLGRVARIILRGPEEAALESFAESLRERLEAARAALGVRARVLGPAPPPIAKLRGKFRLHLLLQCGEAKPLGALIRRATRDFHPPRGEDLQFVIDIDPIDML